MSGDGVGIALYRREKRHRALLPAISSFRGKKVGKERRESILGFFYPGKEKGYPFLGRRR